jgi:hypothetical protein
VQKLSALSLSKLTRTGLLGLDKNRQQKEWQSFKDSLAAIHKEANELSGNSKLKLNQEDKDFLKTLAWSHDTSILLITYHKANKLLIDCLNLAIVSNKDAIIDQLFLPASDS